MRIILADDHELVRAGIRPFLEELGPDATVVEAETYRDALERSSEGAMPALAVLDLRMPEASEGGLEEYRNRFPEVPVVVLSGSVDPEDVFAAVRGGAAGYVPKTFGGPAMLHALRLVLAGERFFPSFAVESALAHHGANGGATVAADGERGKDDTGVLSKLSVRERDILAHMIEGGTNKKIARQLGVQEITVKVHLRNIYRKLGAANRAQAVRIALENGWRAVETS